MGENGLLLHTCMHIIYKDVGELQVGLMAYGMPSGTVRRWEPPSTYSPPAVVTVDEVSSWLGLQPDQVSKVSLWVRKFLWKVWRIVLKRRNPSLFLAAVRRPREGQFVEFGVRGLGTTVTLGFGCVPLGLPLQRHVCGQQMFFSSVLNTNQESYDGREPTGTGSNVKATYAGSWRFYSSSVLGKDRGLPR